jgi:hypothetical protein
MLQWSAVQKELAGLKNHASLVFFTGKAQNGRFAPVVERPTPRDKSEARKNNFI